MTQRPAAALLGATLLALAVLVTGALLVTRGIPRPLGAFLALVAVFVVLDTRSVDMGGGVYLSSSAMVVFTAAVVVGPDHAPTAAAVMALATLVHPDALRPERLSTLGANVGQLALSGITGAWAVSWFVPAREIVVGDLAAVAIGGLVGSFAYDWVNFRLVAAYTERAFPDRGMPSWIDTAPSHASLAVLGLLGSLLGAAYLMVGPLVLPLIVATYAIGHVAFSGQAQLRAAHESAIRGLVKAIEALDPYSKGHTERVAEFVGLAGRAVGLDEDRLERLRWAALVHDVGKLAVPADLLTREGPLDAAEGLRLRRHMASVEAVLSEVDFLRPMLAIVRDRYRLADGVRARGSVVAVEARILAVADEFDALTSSRSYRAAVTQEQAFAILRLRSSWLGSEIVEIFIAAIEEVGEVYGSPDPASTAVVEALVKERAIRA